MIYFDVTKAAAAAHRSGLMRVNSRLREEMGPAVAPVEWASWDRRVGTADWFLTTELFSEAERPGLTDFLRRHACRSAAVFYDAIPLKHPTITWPQSVARHPGYMKLLASFDRIWAISAASRDELLGFWNWAGIAHPPPVEVLNLGADFSRSKRWSALSPTRFGAAESNRALGTTRATLLCIGILEPRKNQVFLLDVCEDLWSKGLDFELHLVGRCNPHFGRPILQRIRTMARQRPGLKYHPSAPDSEMAALYARARAGVFPTLAEGCGLPILESLWSGVPCVCSDLPVLRENADGGGCLPVALNDRAAWKSALRQILTDEGFYRRLADEATTRLLPTWAEAAQAILKRLG